MTTRFAIAAVAALMAFSTFQGGAYAEDPAAANSQIQAVYDDLTRFENQARAASKNSAKRIAKLLKITEGRLQGAPDQDDPSWQAAADRLAALKQQLDNIAAGKPATAPAQTASPPPASSDAPEIRAAPSLDAPATIESGDPVVNAATAEITRLSGLTDLLAPGDKATAKQYLGELQAVGTKLKGVDTKDAAWAEAAKAYNALQGRIVDIANASAPAPAAPPPGSAPAPQTAEVDPGVEKVARELGFNERNLLQMRGGSQKMEQRILGDMTRMRGTLDQVADKDHPSWQEADGEWQRQMDMLAEKRLESIEKQLVSIGEQVDGLDSTALTNDQSVANFQGAIDKLAGEMQVYDAYASRDGYASTWDTHTKVSMRFQEKVAQAKATESQFGDVKANVAAIQQGFKDIPVPRALQTFPDKETVIAYAEAMKKAYVHSTQSAQYLGQIEGKTSQVDNREIKRMKRYAETDRIRQIDASLRETRLYLDGQWRVYQDVLNFRATDNPADRNHQANRFLMPGRYEENIGKLNEGLAFVAILDAYDKTLGTEDNASTLERQAALQNAIAKYDADYTAALSTMRVTPGIDDDELRAIAEKTLENPRYGVHLPWERLEVGKKFHRKEARSEVSGNSIVTNIYEWDEFQARTVEQVDGKWYIFVNDLKFFYSGATTTPLDRWLVSDRWQSSRILEENINK